MLVVLGSLMLAAILLSTVSLRALYRLGDFSMTQVSAALDAQAREALYGLVRERATRHGTMFQNAVSFSRAVADQAAYYLDNIDLYGERGAWGGERFDWHPDKQMFSNPQYALVSSVYWDKDHIDPATRRRINAVSHVDEFLASAMLNNPGAAASWLMLTDTLVRYYPNTHLVDLMPPVSEFDYRNDHCFQLGTPANNPGGSTVWSDVYQDTVGQGLVVTVATPIYSDSGTFLGVTGIDFSLANIVREVLSGGMTGLPDENEYALGGGFSMLLDRDGNVIALPLDRVDELGIEHKDVDRLEPGQLLEYRLTDSSQRGVRELAGRMVRGERGVEVLRVGGEPYMMAFHPMAATGWILGEAVPMSEVLTAMSNTEQALGDEILSLGVMYPFVAFGVTLVALSIAVLFVLRRLFHPMQRLLDATRAVSSGDLDYKVTMPRADEFDSLGRAFNDMTADLRRNQRRLREAEEKYRGIFESAVEGIYQSTPDGRLLSANDAMCSIMGYDAPQEMTELMADLGEQAWVEPARREEFIELMRRDGEVLRYEARLKRKNGSVLWARLGGRGVFSPDGELLYINGVLEDHTDARQASQRIHRLSQELLQTQERERGRIARDLHDDVAQTLSSLKIATRVLFDGHEDIPAEVRGRADELSGRLQDCITAVREMAYDLHPASLDELGFVAALTQYCREYGERTGIQADFMAAGMDAVRLDRAVEINLYRLVQEALSNVEKHSGATGVSVRLVASHPRVILRVADDGRGFDPERQAADAGTRSLGLRSMEERVRLMRGELEVNARPGRGVRIRAGRWRLPAGGGSSRGR